ncbi:MAG: LbtU family siderophore porin, partial [Gammaproteobacteria bacterium]|nr:LbtU family siderophore porin [Gammaproteobacteria bacterium]
MLTKVRFLIYLAAGVLINTAICHANTSNWSGLIEVESAALIDNSDTLSSDILLATAELGYEHYLDKNTSANLIFLHEADSTESVEIDHATINVYDLSGFNLSMGRQYLPFGSFNSTLTSDPLTLELGETREAAIGLSKSFNLATAEAYFFQGDMQPAKNAWLPDFMARVSIADEGNISYSIDAYFISELANSESMSNALGSTEELSHTVSGAGFSALFSMDMLTISAECLGAIKKYSSENFYNKSPKACHFEADIAFTLLNKETSIGIGYGLSKDALGFELPDSRHSVGATILL